MLSPLVVSKSKIDGKEKISHVFKIVLKRNDFLIFKFVNYTSNVAASFNVVLKYRLGYKMVIAIVTLPTRWMDDLLLTLYISQIIRSIGQIQAVCEKTSSCAVVNYWFKNYINWLVKLFFLTF